MFGVRALRIRSSLLASAVAVVAAAAALAAGTGSETRMALKGDRLPTPVKVSCEAAACDGKIAPVYRTAVETDRRTRTTTLTRIPVED